LVQPFLKRKSYDRGVSVYPRVWSTGVSRRKEGEGEMARLQKSREKILESAGRLFSQKGYERTSIHEICMQAGVSKGAFYHYFSTKENLFLILMEGWIERMRGVLGAGKAEGAVFPDNLLEMTENSCEIFETVEENFSVMIEFCKDALRDPSIWGRSVRPVTENLIALTNQLLNAQQDGRIRDDIDASATAHLLMACALGYLFLAALSPEKREWTKLARSGMELVVSSIRS